MGRTTGRRASETEKQGAERQAHGRRAEHRARNPTGTQGWESVGAGSNGTNARGQAQGTRAKGRVRAATRSMQGTGRKAIARAAKWV